MRNMLVLLLLLAFLHGPNAGAMDDNTKSLLDKVKRVWASLAVTDQQNTEEDDENSATIFMMFFMGAILGDTDVGQ